MRTNGLARSTRFSLLIRRLLVLSVALFSLNCFAEATSPQQAKKVVEGWLKTGAHHLGVAHGNKIKAVKTFKDPAGEEVYHVVELEPVGFVIVPAEDECEPIIGFSAYGVFDPSKTNPMGALVGKDLPNRVKAARNNQLLRQTNQNQEAPAEVEAAKAKWARLTELAVAPAGGVATRSLPSGSVIWVAPLVQSTWDQQTVYINGGTDDTGIACYNYYTPPNSAGNVNNYPCGCVATAMAQLMRYYQYPTAGVGTASFTITVNNKNKSANLLGGNGSGGPYNWASMPLTPAASISTAQCQAIGALTYDAGVASNMDYESDGSGTYMDSANTALLNTFGYSNSICGNIYNNSALPAMLNPNLDAGLPVLLALAAAPAAMRSSATATAMILPLCIIT